MKYCLTFQCDSPVELPLNYNNVLQAAILTWLGCNEEPQKKEDGTVEEKPFYRWFTFSEILGKSDYNPQKNKLFFFGQIQIVLAFPDELAHETILKNMEIRRPLRFGRVYVDFTGCTLIEEKHTDSCVVETLSPVSIHSSYEKADGRKGVYYYSPFEKEFSEMVRANLIYKFESIYGRMPEDTRFEIEPTAPEKVQQATVWLNTFFVRSWHGQFIIKGSPELIKLGLLSGLGTKNNLGLGCVVQM